MAEAAQVRVPDVGTAHLCSSLLFLLIFLFLWLCLQLGLYFFLDSHNKALGTIRAYRTQLSSSSYPSTVGAREGNRVTQDHIASVDISHLDSPCFKLFHVSPLIFVFFPFSFPFFSLFGPVVKAIHLRDWTRLKVSPFSFPTSIFGHLDLSI